VAGGGVTKAFDVAIDGQRVPTVGSGGARVCFVKLLGSDFQGLDVAVALN
jgi:hypothetical protein